MITDLIAHSEQQLHLEAAYHQARAAERAAWADDEQCDFLVEHHFCSLAYTRAWGAMMEAWSNWRAACEREGRS